MLNKVNLNTMAWGSAHKIKLHKIHLIQKHPTCFICNGNKFTHIKRIKRPLQVLNVFQINFQKILVFMHRVKSYSDVPSTFANKFTYLSHRYSKNFFKNSFALPKYLNHKSRYKISVRGH